MWFIYIDECGGEHQICQECEDELIKSGLMDLNYEKDE